MVHVSWADRPKKRASSVLITACQVESSSDQTVKATMAMAAPSNAPNRGAAPKQTRRFPPSGSLARNPVMADADGGPDRYSQRNERRDRRGKRCNARKGKRGHPDLAHPGGLSEARRNRFRPERTRLRDARGGE